MLRQEFLPPEDGIWLAACVAARLKGVAVLDAFSGTGVVGLCALHYGAGKVTAVDADADLVGQSMANAGLNSWAARWVPVCAEVSDLKILREKRFDVVLANPPFYAVEAGFKAENTARAAAHGLAAGALAGWLSELWGLVIEDGLLALILHVREVDAVMTFAHENKVAVRWIFLETSKDKPAKRVVVILGADAGEETLQVWQPEVRARVLKQGLVVDLSGEKE